MSRARPIPLAVFALLFCGVTAPYATTYESVTFEQMVQQADVIFLGEVIDVMPFEVRRDSGRSIKTRVTFRVVDPIHGARPNVEIFEFLGGTIGDVTMDVAEMPKFAAGDRRLLFARRERSINPIVGFTQGLMKVSRDARGVDRVLTHDGYPVGRTQALGRPQPRTSVTPIMPMTMSDFRARIVDALAAAGKR